MLLLWGEDYHPGVIGIVASRLVEKYGRPAILVSIQNGEGRGSGRSVAGFNLHAAISACGDLLIGMAGMPWRRACRWSRPACRNCAAA